MAAREARESAPTAVAYRDDQTRWHAVATRDRGADGHFWYSVATTGVYCHPSCAARTPRRRHVAFHGSPAAAERAGFRPCKRCRPDQPPEHERIAAAIGRACRKLDDTENVPSIAELAATVGLSPRQLSRHFKALTGLAPKQYALARRAERLRERLASGSGSITTAVYEAGFGSSSRFYERADALLGMRAATYARGGRGQTIRWDVGDSWLGPVLVAATDRGVCAVLFGETRPRLARELARRFPAATLEEAEAGSAFSHWIEAVLAAIEAPRDPAPLPLDVIGTAFQQRVWLALVQIPPGETATYGEIARRIGAPRAARAVGAACGANPLAILIPCHRVVPADGSPGGYHWGPARKRALLEREAGGRARPRGSS